MITLRLLEKVSIMPKDNVTFTARSTKLSPKLTFLEMAAAVAQLDRKVEDLWVTNFSDFGPEMITAVTPSEKAESEASFTLVEIAGNGTSKLFALPDMNVVFLTTESSGTRFHKALKPEIIAFILE